MVLTQELEAKTDENELCPVTLDISSTFLNLNAYVPMPERNKCRMQKLATWKRISSI